MKKKKIRLPHLSLFTAGKYLLLLLGEVLLSFTLPYHEPVSFALFFASLTCGFHPLLAGGCYLASSAAALSLFAFLSALAQTVFFVLLQCVYTRKQRRMGLERFLYLLLAQIPFVFLFPHAGYALFPFAAIYQKIILGALLLLVSVLFEGGLHALCFSLTRCRLSVVELCELSLLWLAVGAGIGSLTGSITLTAVSLALTFLAVLLLKSTACVPVAVIISLPLCFVGQSLLPVALYAIFALVALLFSSYGKTAALLSLYAAFLIAQTFGGLFSQSVTVVLLTLLGSALPLLLLYLLPEKAYEKGKSALLFYKEAALPRTAINRNRRAVGERLYEVSSLFREIEGAFSEPEQQCNVSVLTEKLKEMLCKNCTGRRKCEQNHIYESMERLVTIGYAKGQVSLVDLTAELSAGCGNAAGLLFACNKLLSDYRARLKEVEAARESKRLLAEQAHGVSQILKDIALEQSEEYSFREGEATLSKALRANGYLSSEIFVYGEGASLTVSLNLPESVNGKTLCKIASDALKIPLSLAEKIPISASRSCFVLKRKPEFDAAFGVASYKKQGESACGDTYSVLKIDERRFLIALSDGMGSGEKARQVSDKTLTLIESFYKAKMPSDTILYTVNKLLSYSSEEMFSCLDLAAVNLDTGAADIVKIGSPVGFILSKEELRVLEGESLPMGMLDTVHPATMQAQMNENDYMLFLSDGVTGAFGSSTELYSYLSTVKPLNPQSLAEDILNKALSYYHGVAEDDMTVLAVKLQKTA